MRAVETDVLVIGAGPAGASAAFFLAREGFNVLAIDRARFPRDKVCGDGIAPRAVAMLQRMGLEETLLARGYRPIEEYRIVSSWGEAVKAGVTSFGKGSGYSFVVPRKELDVLLLALARDAGATVMEGIRALDFRGGLTSQVVGRSVEGEDIRFTARVVIAADGSRGSFSRKIMPQASLEPYALGIRAYMEGVEDIGQVINIFLDHHLLPGYSWIFPGGREGEPANVGLGVKVAYLRRRRERLRRLFDWLLSPGSLAWPHLRKACLVSPPAPFPLQLDFPKGRRRQGTTLFVGDAANLINPLSGEGVAYALQSGEAAAVATARYLHSGRVRDLAGYEEAIWRELSLEFLGAYVIRQLLVRPWANGVEVHMLRRDEALARGAMGILTNHVPATWMARRAVWRRVLSRERLARLLRADRPAWG